MRPSFEARRGFLKYLRRAAGPDDLLVHMPEFVVGQTFEFAPIEPRKLVDPVAREVGDQTLAVGIEAGMADGQQKELRLEPPSGVDCDVVRAARTAVNDEPVNLAELVA